RHRRRGERRCRVVAPRLPRRPQAACRPRRRGSARASASKPRKAAFTERESGNRRASSGSRIRRSAEALAALAAYLPRTAFDQSYRAKCPSRRRAESVFRIYFLLCFAVALRARRRRCGTGEFPEVLELVGRASARNGTPVPAEG